MAHRIRLQILNSSKQLISNPKSGQIEWNLEKLNLKHRYILCGNYKIIYRILNSQIIINDVFDTRQHPSKMYDLNKL
ncbi:MAG: type II toxin-antitoxin system RelE/ParE family toxin [Flavobacteriales bacterium]